MLAARDFRRPFGAQNAEHLISQSINICTLVPEQKLAEIFQFYGDLCSIQANLSELQRFVKELECKCSDKRDKC